MALDQVKSSNRFINNLSSGDLELISPNLEYVDLKLRRRLDSPRAPARYAYFLSDGIASVVSQAVRGRQVELGIIGREGVTGLCIPLGVDRFRQEVYMQVAGVGHRIAADELRAAMAESKTLHNTLLVYVHLFMSQVAGTALANGLGKLEERLARWLLMAQDRLLVDDLPLTHEFLSIMLGVHRPGVTLALSSLQRNGLVVVKRGSISIVDRSSLKSLAGRFYGAPEAEQRRVFKSD